MRGVGALSLRMGARPSARVTCQVNVRYWSGPKDRRTRHHGQRHMGMRINRSKTWPHPNTQHTSPPHLANGAPSRQGRQPTQRSVAFKPLHPRQGEVRDGRGQQASGANPAVAHREIGTVEVLDEIEPQLVDLAGEESRIEA